MGLTDGVLLVSGFGLIRGLKSALGRSGSVGRVVLIFYRYSERGPVYGASDRSHVQAE